MPRLIDANALKKRAIEMEIFMPYGGDGTTMAVEVDAIESAPTLDYAPRQQWISVEDRLPEHETPVLVGYSRNLDGFVCIGYLDYEDMRWCGLDDIRIARPTHWMPLPEPPKEE